MKLNILLPAVLLTLFFMPANQSQAQSIPTVDEVKNFFMNQQMLITYREGEAVYGTYFFFEVHYCPQGYGLYARTNKQTILGNEQRNNWQELGTWEVIQQGGTVGINSVSTAGARKYTPVYKLANGDYWLGEGISLVKEGPAMCN